MLIKKQVVGLKRSIFIVILTMISFLQAAQAASHFRLEKDAQGMIRPFRIVALPLPDFIREYGKFTQTQIITAGNWDKELKGSVTLFLKRSLKQEDLTEIFYRVLADNGYSVLDAAPGNGWIIERQRDARDDALPLYALKDVPATSRLVTVFHELKYAPAENVARMMRSFMPTNSRIIPSGKYQVFITDTGSNIRKLGELISRMDIPAAAKRQKEGPPGPFGATRTCGERRIEKLIVEKLEIQNGGNPGSIPQMKGIPEGVRK